MKRMKRCRGQFSWVWVWILIWRIDLECSTQILDILTPADGNILILSFLFPNPFAINSRKNRGRRRTLGRQTPTSPPYNFIMNTANSFYKSSSPISPNSKIPCIDTLRIRDASNYFCCHPCRYVLTACIIFDRTMRTYHREVFNVSSQTQQ